MPLIVPYTVTFLHRKTGKDLVSHYESYMPAYRALCDLAYQVGYEVHSIHQECLVVAGTQTSEYFIHLTQDQSHQS